MSLKRVETANQAIQRTVQQRRFAPLLPGR
jgi:hypothetical protein